MNKFWLLLLMPIFLFSCIGDDIIFDTVEEQLRLTIMADSIAVGDSFQFEARFTNNVGQAEPERIQWTSSNEEVIIIDQNGLAMAVSSGNSTITVAATTADNSVLSETIEVAVGSVTIVSEEVATVRQGVIQTTTFYDLSGDFTLEEVDDKLLLSIADNYLTTSALPGLYLYLTNNPNTISGAFEIGEVTVFAGAHSYEISGAGLNDYDYLLYFCKPFNVKVGDGKIE